MEAEEESESIRREQSLESIVSPGILVTPVQVAITSNLFPVINGAHSIIHASYQESATFRVPTAAKPKLIHKSTACESSTTIAQRTKKIPSVSQILSIPRIETNKTRKKSTALHCHNKLLTSAAFVVEVQEKLDRDAAKELAIEERKKKKQEKSSKRKKEKENKKVDTMVKRWIKEMEKKESDKLQAQSRYYFILDLASFSFNYDLKIGFKIRIYIAV